MRKTLGMVLAVLALLTSTACSDLAVLGSGTVVTETREVSGFNEVSLKGTGTLIIEQGDQEALTIEAEDNILPLIQTEVDDQQLKISYTRNRTMRTTMPVYFYLKVKDITKVSLSGSSSMEAQELRADHLETTIDGAGRVTIDHFEGETFRSKIDGTGEIFIAGTVTEHSMSLAGSGGYHAGDLVSQAAQISITGNGEATVRAAQTLRVEIGGSGEVFYYGDPSVEQKISGAGKVTRLTE